MEFNKKTATAFLFGLVLLLYGISDFVKLSEISKGDQVVAIVDYVSESSNSRGGNIHNAIVHYTYKGNEYTEHHITCPSYIKAGDTMMVTVHPRIPERIYSDIEFDYFLDGFFIFSGFLTMVLVWIFTAKDDDYY